jgi:hypothetical protein
LRVISHAEVPDGKTIKVTSMIGQAGMIKKFHAATTRDALRQVRDELGANAIILSNRQVERRRDHRRRRPGHGRLAEQAEPARHRLPEPASQPRPPIRATRRAPRD